MDKKDIVTLAISALAFVLALVTFIQKGYENRRTMRIQLTETMSKLMALLGEIDRLRYERDELKHLEVRGPLNKLTKQLYSVAMQADFLIQRLPAEMISDVEYSNVANSFWPSDDYYRARFYFKKSISAAERSDKREGEAWYFNMRTARYIKDYANFLFSQGDPTAGREQYEKAVSLLSGDREQVLLEKGWAYMMWARSEARVLDMEGAKTLRGEALAAINSIRNEEWKRKALDDLSRELKNYFPADPAPAGVTVTQPPP